jgi:hypothetical protein
MRSGSSCTELPSTDVVHVTASSTSVPISKRTSPGAATVPSTSENVNVPLIAAAGSPPLTAVSVFFAKMP